MITVEEYIKLKEQPIETLANELLHSSKAAARTYNGLLKWYNFGAFDKRVEEEKFYFPEELRLNYATQDSNERRALKIKREQYIDNLLEEYNKDCQEDEEVRIGRVKDDSFVKRTYIKNKKNDRYDVNRFL